MTVKWRDDVIFVSTKQVNKGDDTDVTSLELLTQINLVTHVLKTSLVSCASQNPCLSQLTVQSHDVFISVTEQTSLCRQVNMMHGG